MKVLEWETKKKREVGTEREREKGRKWDREKILESEVKD